VELPWFPLGLQGFFSRLQRPAEKVKEKAEKWGAASPRFPQSKVGFSSSSWTPCFAFFCAEFKAIAVFHGVAWAINVNDMVVDRLDLNSSPHGWGLHRLLKALWGGGKERVMQKGGGRT
jgi:hypothetical protein